MNGDRWLGPSLMLFGLAWLWLVRVSVPDAGGEWPGPRGFPLLLGIIIASLGALMTILALVSQRRVQKDPAYALEGDAPATRREAAVAGGTFGLLILYAFLLEAVGFVIATPFVIVLTMLGLARTRRWSLILPLALGFTLGCWAVFDALLGTPLPRGSWVPW